MSHRKVQVWIFSRDAKQAPSCLLLKTNKARGQFWQPVTGTVEDHEGFFEAACREPLEETGFDFEAPPADTGYEFEFASRFGHTKEHVFALQVDGEPKPKIDPKEHDDFQWTAPKDALKLLRYPSNVDGLRKAFKLLFKKDLGKE